MKRLLSILFGILLLAIPTAALATTTGWDFNGSIVQPLTQQLNALIRASRFQATSVTLPSTFPYASTTALSATSLCLSTDCRTSWPTGTAYPFPLTGNATSSPLMLLASTTIGNGTQAGGLTVSGGATTTGDAHLFGNVILAPSPGTFTTVAPFAQIYAFGRQATNNLADPSTYGLVVHAATGDNSGGVGPGIGLATANTTGLTSGGITGAITALRTGTNGQGKLAFYTKADTGANAPLVALTLDQTQKAGFGSTSPYAKLSVHANNGDTNQTLFAIGSSTATATSTLFSVLNTGNVGIGTGAPTYPLDINLGTQGSNSKTGALLEGNAGGGVADTGYYLSQSNSTDNSAAIFALQRTGASSFVGLNIGSDSRDGIAFGAQDSTGSPVNSPTERMRLTSLGLLGIGTTSPYAALSVVGTTTSAVFEATTTATSTSNGGWNIQGGCFAVRGTCAEQALTFNSPLSRIGNAISFLFNTVNTWTGLNTFNATTTLATTTLGSVEIPTDYTVSIAGGVVTGIKTLTGATISTNAAVNVVLTAIFANAASSSATIYVQPGIYPLATTTLIQHHGITINCPAFDSTFADQVQLQPGMQGAATFQASSTLGFPASAPIFQVGNLGSNKIYTGGSINNCILAGTKGVITPGDGVDVFNQQAFGVYKNGITNVAKAVNVQSDISGGISNVNVEHNIIYFTTDIGIYLGSGSDENYARFNYISDATGHAIYTGGISNTVLNNHIEGTVLAGSGTADGAAIYSSGADSYIWNNDIQESHTYGIYNSNSSVSIDGNFINNVNTDGLSTGAGIWTDGNVTGVEVSGNNIFDHDSHMVYGIYDTSGTAQGVTIGINAITGYTKQKVFSVSSLLADIVFLSKLGVGTTTPQTQFEVVSAGAGARINTPGNSDWFQGYVSNQQFFGLQYKNSLFVEMQSFQGKPLVLNDQGNNVGVGTTSPWKLFSVGTSNTGTFAVSTSTSGCASFSPFGELYSTGTACGTSSGGLTVDPNWNYFQATGGNYIAPTSTTVGIGVFASSTIGNGAGAGGLTISGNSTTTANAYIAGNLGIATTSPTKKLEVLGDEYITGSIGVGLKTTGGVDSDISVKKSAISVNIQAQSTNTSGVTSLAALGDVANISLTARGSAASGVNLAVLPSAGYIDMSAGTGGIVLLNRLAAPIIFATGGIALNNERARILGTGETGFASTSPYARLSIHANPTDPFINQTLFAIGSSTATATSTLLAVLNTGNVGIGTSSPGTLLSINNIANFTTGTSTLYGPFEIKSNTAPDTTQVDYLRLNNSAGSATGRSGIGFFQSSGASFDSAQITSSPGSGFNASKLFFSVADSSKVLRDRMTIDVNGQIANANGDVFTALASYVVSTTTATGNFTDVQTAVNALPTGGGLIHVRCGAFTLPTATYGILVKVANTVIEGEGNCTQFNFDKANTPNAFGLNATGLAGVKLSGVYFHQTNGTFGGIGINASNTPLFLASQVKIDGTATSVQIKDTVNQSFYQTYKDLDLRDNTSCIELNGNPVNNNLFQNTRCALHAGNKGFAYYLDSTNVNGAQNNTFINPNSEPTGAGTGLTAIYANAAVDNQFIDPYIEADAVGWNFGANSQRNQIIGGQFITHTTYTNAGTSNSFQTDRESQVYNLMAASSTIQDISGSDASLPDLAVYGNGNFAKTANIFDLFLNNGTDSGNAINIKNPGTGSGLRISSTGTGNAASTTGTIILHGLTAFATGDSAVCLRNAGNGALTFDSGVSSCIVSSQFVKSNITNDSTPAATDRIMALNPVTFNYIDTNQADIGLIAEKVAQIDPRYAQYTDQAKDLDGHHFNAGDPTAINWSAVTGDLIKVVQNQQQEIQALSGGAKQSVEDHWQDILIGLLLLGFGWQQYQIRKLKK